MNARTAMRLRVRMLPYLASRVSPDFSMQHCNFKVGPGRWGADRAIWECVCVLVMAMAWGICMNPGNSSIMQLFNATVKQLFGVIAKQEGGGGWKGSYRGWCVLGVWRLQLYLVEAMTRPSLRPPHTCRVGPHRVLHTHRQRTDSTPTLPQHTTTMTHPEQHGDNPATIQPVTTAIDRPRRSARPRWARDAWW